MKIAIGGLSLVLIFMFFCCSSQKTEWQGSIEEVDGVTAVMNPKEPKYLDKTIILNEDLSIGVDEGDENYMFSAPVDIDSDSEGNIYVLDFRELTIKKYNPDGIFERNISRMGEGPGEIQAPYGICIDTQDLIYILDFMERNIEVFNTQGEFQKAIKLNVLADIIALNQADEIILKYDQNVMEDEKTRRRVSKIGKFASQDNTIADFFNKDKPFFRGIQRSGEYRIEIPYERFDVDTRGNVYVGTTNEYEISVYAPNGELFLKFSKEYEPIPRDPEIVAKAVNQLTKSTPPKELPKYKELIDNHPIFTSISVDEKDRTWIGLFQLLGENETRKLSNFDVFSSSGEFLFEVKIPRDIRRQLVFKNGYVYALATNESGYSRALRLSIEEN
jgi:hypothetical protein